MSKTKTSSSYVGPTVAVHRLTHVYLYDAGSGELIAELSPEAAEQVRNHPDQYASLHWDGHGHVTLDTGAKA